MFSLIAGSILTDNRASVSSPKISSWFSLLSSGVVMLMWSVSFSIFLFGSACALGMMANLGFSLLFEMSTCLMRFSVFRMLL
ncbi:hypothetical protein D3C78_1789650 [compost metagenome]